MRVLFVLPSLSLTNGVTAFVKNYLPRMKSENLQFEVLCSTADFSQENYDYFTENEIKVHLIPPVNNGGIKNYSRCLDNFFKENTYDLVYSHISYVSILVYYSAKKFGVKNFAIHSHATKLSPNCFKNLIANMLKPVINKCFINRFACSTEAGRALFSNRDFVLIPNAIDYDKYKYDELNREAVRKTLNIKPEEKCIGFVGRFTSQKNIFYFIDIAKKLNNIKILMIGNGELKDEFKEKIKEEGIEDKFIVLDATPNVCDFYSAMDVFMMPSLYEGLPVAALEAQANNLPCLLSNTISQETSISGSTKYLELSNLSSWIKEIENSKRKAQEELCEKFNIEKQAENYKEKIINCVKLA